MARRGRLHWLQKEEKSRWRQPKCQTRGFKMVVHKPVGDATVAILFFYTVCGSTWHAPVSSATRRLTARLLAMSALQCQSTAAMGNVQRLEASTCSKTGKKWTNMHNSYSITIICISFTWSRDNSDLISTWFFFYFLKNCDQDIYCVRHFTVEKLVRRLWWTNNVMVTQNLSHHKHFCTDSSC